MMQSDVSKSCGPGLRPREPQRFRHAVLYLDAQRLQDLCQVSMSLEASDNRTLESISCLQACSQHAVMVSAAKQGCNSLQPGAA